MGARVLCCAFYARVVVVCYCTQKSDVLDKRTDEKERPSREFFLSREESFFLPFLSCFFFCFFDLFDSFCIPCFILNEKGIVVNYSYSY